MEGNSKDANKSGNGNTLGRATPKIFFTCVKQFCHCVAWPLAHIPECIHKWNDHRNGGQREVDAFCDINIQYSPEHEVGVEAVGIHLILFHLGLVALVKSLLDGCHWDGIKVLQIENGEPFFICQLDEGTIGCQQAWQKVNTDAKQKGIVGSDQHDDLVGLVHKGMVEDLHQLLFASVWIQPTFNQLPELGINGLEGEHVFLVLFIVISPNTLLQPAKGFVNSVYKHTTLHLNRQKLKSFWVVCLGKGKSIKWPEQKQQ